MADEAFPMAKREALRESKPRLARRVRAGATLLFAGAPLLGLLGCVRVPPPITLLTTPEPLTIRTPYPALRLHEAPSPRATFTWSNGGDYDFFGTPPVGDLWSYRIGGWQVRQQAAQGFLPLPAHPRLPPVAAEPLMLRETPRASGALGRRFRNFLRFDAPFAGTQRQRAEAVLDFVQGEARTRFVEDGPIDHWPTLTEMLAAEGDDCDGFELLANHALRELGFGDAYVYRAILRRPRSGEHHMVTLWFEDPDDPWVLDPTATITTRLQRLSELRGWEPLKMFTETRNFTVVPR